MQKADAQPPVPHCDHYGAAPVKVGPYQIHLGGAYYFRSGDIEGFDLYIPLAVNATVPFLFGQRYSIFAAPLTDFGGAPATWKEFLLEVIEELRQGKKVLAYCLASHGRTGMFAASLIALLETSKETPDPIAAIRKRHCKHAVESWDQTEAIFNLRGETVPSQYLPQQSSEQPIVKVKAKGRSKK